MVMRGKVTTSSDLRGLEILKNGVAVPKRVTMSMSGRLGDPDASLLFEVRDGQPVCIEFIVKAKPDGRGLRGADLERVNLNALTERAFSDFAYFSGGGPIGGSDESETRRLRKGIETAIYAPGRGPTPAELKEVARIYREHPHAPTAAVEKLMRYSRRTACRRVRAARDAGLLTPTAGTETGSRQL